MNLIKSVRKFILRWYAKSLLNEVVTSEYSQKVFLNRVKNYTNRTDIYLEFCRFFGSNHNDEE